MHLPAGVRPGATVGPLVRPPQVMRSVRRLTFNRGAVPHETCERWRDNPLSRCGARTPDAHAFRGSSHGGRQRHPHVGERRRVRGVWRSSHHALARCAKKWVTIVSGQRMCSVAKLELARSARRPVCQVFQGSRPGAAALAGTRAVPSATVGANGNGAERGHSNMSMARAPANNRLKLAARGRTVAN